MNNHLFYCRSFQIIYERILLGKKLRNNNRTQLAYVVASTDRAHEHFYSINFMTMTLQR